MKKTNSDPNRGDLGTIETKKKNTSANNFQKK